MKRVLIWTVAFAGLGLATPAALAADLARPAPRAAYPTKAPEAHLFDWTGFYAGLNGGYGWGDSKFTGAGNANTSPEGAILGGTIGYNYQWGQTVFGVESDIGWNNAKGSTNCALGSCETKSNWLGTTRLRLGYAFDRLMPYVTGGAAYGDVKARVPGLGSDSDTQFGWTVGGGLEYAFTPNWTVKAEYLHVDLGKLNCAVCGGDVKFNENIVRGGVNYKF
jgi:outer membrane immunogenic protein